MRSNQHESRSTPYKEYSREAMEKIPSDNGFSVGVLMLTLYGLSGLEITRSNDYFIRRSLTRRSVINTPAFQFLSAFGWLAVETFVSDSPIIIVRTPCVISSIQ